MTTAWHRCSAGRWSVVLSKEAGTTCAPEGLTTDFDFHTQYNGGKVGAIASASSTPKVTSDAIGAMLAAKVTILGGLAIALMV